MKRRGKAEASTSPIRRRQLPKCPTGISGLDEVTGGGLPRGRPTLVCGSAGCGKSLLAMEFLVRGATEFDEPGVLMSFEESARDVTQNVASLGFDLDQLIEAKKLIIDHVRVDRSEIEETGEYDLEALFIRLGYAIDSIGAKRVVLDTIESLFSGLSNDAILRSELRRLFEWLKEKGVTAVITGEQGEKTLTRQGLEEYVSDCVIFLDHRIVDQVSTRRLRVVKYRGSVHGTNEYPFLIDESGITVLPVTAVGLSYDVSTDRIPSGVSELDQMLGGKGFFRGSTILVSGTAGTGKSSIAANFADTTCRRGERCLYFAFEESPQQIMRNMRSIGINLEPWVRQGLLKFHAARPTVYGLETHLARINQEVVTSTPRVVVLDPVGNLISVGRENEVRSMLLRLIDLLKMHQITTLMTSLTSAQDAMESSDVGMSSLMDTWLLLRDIEINGERNRGLYLLKSRGMPHSNQIREFLLTDQGIKLIDVYVGTSGVLTGSARRAQEAQETAAAVVRQRATARKVREVDRKRIAMEAQIAAIRAAFAAEEAELNTLVSEDQSAETTLKDVRDAMALSRHAGVTGRKRDVRTMRGAARTNGDD
ncbi:MAG TPA: circadian clock protein KaiC [Tepidisphaeraceae bacterium]